MIQVGCTPGRRDMVHVDAKTSSRYHKPVQWPICVKELYSIQYNMLFRPGPIKRPELGIMVSSGANNVLGGCGTKADYRWNQGFARSCLPQVSSQFGLALLSSLLLPQPTIACYCNAPFACACACTLAGLQYWSPLPRHFLRPPAKSSSDARRLPRSLHPQILAAYALLQLALPWAPAVERLAAFAWVLRLRLRVAMM